MLSFLRLERYNAVKLVQFVHSCLAALSRVIRGANLLSGDVQTLAQALLQGETPLNWQAAWDGPEDPIQFLRGLILRATALDRWLDRAERGSLLSEELDLSELFHPDTFLNALRQQTARDVGCSMDNLRFATSWRGAVHGAKHAVRLGGLQLEGGVFDGVRLTESARDSPSVCSVPVVSVAWIPKVRFCRFRKIFCSSTIAGFPRSLKRFKSP